MTQKKILQALSDGHTHSAGELATTFSTIVEDVILRAQPLREKGWLQLQRNDQAWARSPLNITPEGLDALPNLED
jgi:hypothetical protein